MKQQRPVFPRQVWHPAAWGRLYLASRHRVLFRRLLAWRGPVPAALKAELWCIENHFNLLVQPAMPTPMLAATPTNDLRWSAAEHAALRQQWRDAPKADVLAALPGRSWFAAQRQATRLGLERRYATTRANAWTAADDALLRRVYATQGPAATAALLGRTPRTVAARACRLQVRHRQVGLTPAPPKPPRAKAPEPPIPAAALRAPAPKPAPKLAAAAQGLPAKKRPHLQNLNAQKAATQRQAARAPIAPVTAAYIRGLGYHHPEAAIYRVGGSPAVLAYRAQQQAA